MSGLTDNNNNTMNNKFDVVIAGGGLSGCLTALSLADCKHANGTPLSIAIVEANPILSDASLTFDDRVLALSHGTSRYFEKLGAWQTLRTDAEPIKRIHISDRGYYGKARLDANDHDVSALGYVVEMSLIGKSLLTALKPKNNVHWFAPNSIQAIKWQSSDVQISLDNDESLNGKLLLACDGGMSACRQFANIGVDKHDYGQAALIANVSTSKPHDNIAYERFTETGPIAMLPLSAGKHQQVNQGARCSLVWTLTPEKAETMQALSDDLFKLQLESAFGSWLGAITHVGKRNVYPLSLVQAQEQIYHRMALVGNASHTIHPIAGQGFNLGVRDVQQLAKLISQALSHHQDIGGFSLLNQYAQHRKADQQQVIALTDSLVTLFSNDLAPLVVGRNIGLKVLNYFTPLKNALVKKTMGY